MKNSILVLCVLVIVYIKCQYTSTYQLVSVKPTDSTINAVTNYTWTFNITSSLPTPRSTMNMQLIFASSVKLSATSKVYYLTTQVTPVSPNGNKLSFLYPAGLINGTISIVVTLITNPSEQLLKVYMNSTINSLLSSTEQLLSPTVWKGGILQICNWKFTGTTQTQKQNLTIQIKTSNIIQSGNRLIQISPTAYTNTPFDSYKLSNSSISLECSFSFDNSQFYNASCDSSQSNKIKVNITLNSSLANGSDLYLFIQQVNNPPTTTISVPNSYSVITYGLQGIIDYPPTLGCTIQVISATSFIGNFTVTQTINNNYTNPRISVSNTVYPSIKLGDSLIMGYTTDLQCISGTQLKISRGTALIGFSNISNTNVQRTYQANISDSGSASLILQLDCTIIVPTSAQPAIFTFNFKRGTPLTDYMIITATLTAQTATLVSLNMNTSTTQMFTEASYTFPIKISHPLSSKGRIDIDLEDTVDLSNFSSSCSISWNNTSGGALCSITNTVSKIIQVNFTFVSNLTANTIITLIINNIINPKSPSKAFFGITTYYDSSISSSKVQSNSLACNFTPTVHTVQAALSPTSFGVYESALFTITYNNQLVVPANSIFKITFPLTLTNVTFNNGTVNSTSKSFISAKTLPSNIMNLTYSQIITGNSTFVFSFNGRMPKQMITLSSIVIQLIAANGTKYQTVTSGLEVSVSLSNDASYTISPAILTTGSLSSYNITFVTQVPHQNQFYLYITPPDSSYNLAAVECSPICQKTITKINSTTFQIKTANITLANQTTTFVFKLSNLTNLRSVSTSGVWKFESLTTNKSIITAGSAVYSITKPNVLNGFLSLDDAYYRNNTNLVNLNLTFFNVLKTTDFIRLQIPNTAYVSDGSISCHVATCVQDPNLSSTQLLFIQVTNVSGGTVLLHIDGLRSSSNTTYTDSSSITVTTLTSSLQEIDQGTVKYNISCSSVTLRVKNCKQCYIDGTCKNCYFDSISAFYFYNGTCTTNCGSISQYLYAVTGICENCAYPCRTCLNSSACLTCQNATTLYYFSNYTCNETCPISDGYFIKSYLSSGYQIYQCTPCSINCLVCTNETFCTACSSTTVISDNRCLGDCPTNYYNSNGCKPCDNSCTGGCTGGTNKNCQSCATGYFNYSGQCVSSCPSGTAKINAADCGCESVCVTCATLPSNCLSCATINSVSYFAYNGGCVSQCPNATYRSNSTCVDCAQGCGSCNSNTCIKCISAWYLYQNDCFSDCNSISSQHDVDSTGQKCVLCPNGCDTCSGGNCTSCLPQYTLNSTSCILTCSLTNSCVQQSPVPDRVLPIPGTISVVIWLAIAIILKLIIWKSYLPYIYIMIGAIIQLILTFVLTINVGENLSSARLLVQISTAHRSPVLALFIVGLALNYISNIIYIVLFCKYIRPLMPDRQIDLISNGFFLFLGTILNYRLCLAAYSKLFPKPQIPIDNHTRLTPIHYLCIATIILSAITIAAASVLIYNQYALTDLFMLSIDYLIVTLINILFTIWMVSISKSDEYYENQNKKYSIQQFYRTEEGMNQGNNKNDKEHSKANFNNDVEFAEDQNSGQFQKEDYYKKLNNKNNDVYGTHNYGQSDSQNLPLPLKVSVLQAVPVKIESKVNIEDLQLQDNSFTLQASQNQGSNVKLIKDKNDRGLPIKHGKQSPRNYSKEKNKLKHSQSYQKSIHNSSEIKIKKEKGSKNNILKTKKADDYTDDNGLEDQGYNKPSYQKSEDQNIKLRKPTTQRQTGLKMDKNNQSGVKMLKTNRVQLFQSQAGESQVEDIDIQQIIQSKIMDIKQNETKTENQNEMNSIENQDISPSWFNIQNQRFDISDIEDKQ